MPGPSWSAEADSGNRIVVPYLRGEGVRRLDALVVTHADDDHAGGAASVAKSRSPRWLLSSLPPEATGAACSRPVSVDCLAGARWEWDGVDFEVLHPDAAALRDRAARERPLLRGARRGAAGARRSSPPTSSGRRRRSSSPARAERLRADALLVPHHGSRSSSTPAFVAAVSPAVALVSVGWRNRFGQPSPSSWRATAKAARRSCARTCWGPCA